MICLRASMVFGFAFICILAVPGMGLAQDYPSKPIRLIVPWSPGGYTDIVARVLSESLSAALGQPMIIDNRAGASGAIGTELAAKAQPDGYTLIHITSSTHAMSPSLSKRLRYDPIKDFAPIGQVTADPKLLVVTSSLPVNSLAGLVALGKSKPGHLNYASFGNGTAAHFAAELFMRATGTSLTHIPYKGAAPAVADLLGGHVSVFFDSIPSSMPHVRSGKLKALAVTGLKRTITEPDIPAVAETYPGFEVTVWQGFGAPAETPKAVITKFNAILSKVMKLPALRERLIALGANPLLSSTPDEFANHIVKENIKWAAIVKSANIPMEN